MLGDSYRLLPLSLAELGKSFGVDSQKGNFPHEFVREDNLGYVGQDPMNPGIGGWSLRTKCLEYLKSDLDCLYEVLVKFEKFCRANYYLNLNDYISLPAITMGIFRTKFLESGFKIPVLKGRCEAKCRLAYRGGNSEIYKPRLRNG